MNYQISILNRSILNYEILKHPPLKEIQLNLLKSKAGEFGYSFEHYEKTGVWAKLSELENGKVQNPCNLVESRVLASIPDKINCKNCKIEFVKRKDNQVFCSESCKNKFHNLNKKSK